VLEPLGSGFVIAPDLKITKINGEIETLAGGYAAHVQDKHLLLGGGGYWLANGKADRELGYGGGLAGWIFRPDRAVSFTTKGLVGLGWLSVREFTLPLGTPADFTYGRPVIVGEDRNTRAFRLNRQFFVAEPEVDVQVTLTPHLRVTAGGSYRLVDLPRGLDDLAQGPSGSVSVQFRFGK
jgi:hypothetical protein